MHYMHDGWAWWSLMSVSMIAFWGLVAYGIMRVVRGSDRAPGPRRRPKPPPTVLEHRLASGELSVEEFERMRDVLASRPGAAAG